MKNFATLALLTSALLTFGCASCPVCENACPAQTPADAVQEQQTAQDAVQEILETNDINEVYAFVKAQKTYYIATADGEQPRVRPFGTIHIFEGKLYFQTGKKKLVAQQIDANHSVEIVSYDNKGKWMRITGDAIEDPRIEAQESMLEEYPELKKMYTPGDGNTVVYYLDPAVVTVSQFGAEDRIFQIK